MKKLLILLMLLVYSSFLHAAFEDVGKAARAKGMANAFYGEPAGVSSIYYNPAGTAFSKSIEIMGNMGLPYTGFSTIELSTFNGAILFPFTHHFKVEAVFENAVIGGAFNDLSFFYENSKDFDDDQIDYYERVIKINYAKDFLDMMGRGTRFAIGLNFNLYSRGLGANIDTEANSSYFSSGLDTSGMGLDLGFMFFLNMNMILGVAIDNILEPNVAFNKDISEQPVHRTTKLGLSWRLTKLAFFKYPTIAGGVSFEDLKEDVWEYRLGFQFWTFEKVLAFRFGYETSDEGMNSLAVGLTGNPKLSPSQGIEVSYAFNLPLASIRGSSGTHTFSLTWRYNRPEYQFEFDQRKRQSMIKKYEEETAKEDQEEKARIQREFDEELRREEAEKKK
ncbi:MAG: hypothetical protein KKH98_13435 [Spirochaetes bacterium]|nr:hypothetical protein [Spirochaetota bacterium]